MIYWGGGRVSVRYHKNDYYPTGVSRTLRSPMGSLAAAALCILADQAVIELREACGLCGGDLWMQKPALRKCGHISHYIFSFKGNHHELHGQCSLQEEWWALPGSPVGVKQGRRGNGTFLRFSSHSVIYSPLWEMLLNMESAPRLYAWHRFLLSTGFCFALLEINLDFFNVLCLSCPTRQAW